MIMNGKQLRIWKELIMVTLKGKLPTREQRFEAVISQVQSYELVQ
jgi:hypothetical protein